MARTTRTGIAATLFLIATSGAAVRAQFVLTTTEGATLEGAPVGLGDGGALLWRSGGETKTFARDALVGFESSAPETKFQGGARLDLLGGDVLYGRVEEGPADLVRLVVDGLGPLLVKLEDVRLFRNLDGVDGESFRIPDADPQSEDDRLYIERDGRLDSLPGVLERLGKNGVLFSSDALGEKREFAYVKNRVVAVRLAPSEAKPHAKRDAVVRLRTGTRVSGALVGDGVGGLALSIDGGAPTPLNLAEIKSVSFASGAFAILSDMTPLRSEARPFVEGAASRPTIRDRGARPGDPLLIGDERFAKGLLIFGGSAIAYPATGYARLTAKIGVDPATKSSRLPGAAVLVVEKDGVVAWRSEILRAGAPAIPISVPIDGAKEVALRAEFADSFDSGARVVVGNPMLLKAK
jgi:hypothetical protein